MLAALFCAIALAAPLQTPPVPTPLVKPEDTKSTVKDPLPDDEKTIRTTHESTINGVKISYDATVGFLPIRNKQNETEGRIFFTAYTKNGIPAGEKRPLLFAFNGGPGSASLWLHMGAIGPRRVKMLDDGNLPPPPYGLVDNESTWLDKADLVFIDPIGTGYSRPSKPELGPKFWGVEGDLDSISEFIRMYLSRNERWNSPLFVAGESYGTTRAAALTERLLDNGIALNGVLLLSSVLNFALDDTGAGHDSGYSLYLPTYAASAWYHHKLGGSGRDLRKILTEAETWAAADYPAILAKGDTLTASERGQAVTKLNSLTGLQKTYLDNADLRVSPWYFEKELLRDQKRTVGRYDSRIKGIDESGISSTTDYDASYAAVRAPFTTAFNQYMRSELGYKTDTPYFVLGEGLTAPWNWGREGAGGLNVATRLRSAMVQNPYMKVFFAGGHYDLATPYYAAKYTVNHMGLEPNLRKNITFAEYEAGHMMYIETASRLKLKADVGAFLDAATGK